MDTFKKTPDYDPYFSRLDQLINFASTEAFKEFDGSSSFLIKTTNFAMDWDGTLTVKKAGAYTF